MIQSQRGDPWKPGTAGPEGLVRGREGQRSQIPAHCTPQLPKHAPEPKVGADLAVSETKAWGDPTWSHYEV